MYLRNLVSCLSNFSKLVIEPPLKTGKHKGAGGKSVVDRDNDSETTTESYSCPVCDTFVCASLQELNDHVDACLQKDDEGGDPKVEVPCDADEEIHSDQELFGSGSPKLEDSSLDLFGGLGEENTENQKSTANSVLTEIPLTHPEDSPLPPSTSNGISQRKSFSCPVCGSEVGGNLITLNRHIDQCLQPSTAPTISSISDKGTKAKRKRPSSEAQPDNKIRRIDSFFAKRSKI